MVDGADRHWTEVYYDACAFYSAEPQHLRKPQRRTAADDREHAMIEVLRRREVPLNHLLDFLFVLGSDRLIVDVINRAIGERWLDAYEIVGRDYEARYGMPVNSVQPDFAFDGVQHFVSMEMKVSARTDPKQLMKYLFLHARAEANGARPRRHALIYLGPGTWPDLWKDRQDLSYETRLEQAIAAAPATIGLDRVILDVVALSEMAGRVRLGYLSYSDLSDLLVSIRDTMAADSWEGAVARRVLDGVISEFTERGLTSGKRKT